MTKHEARKIVYEQRKLLDYTLISKLGIKQIIDSGIINSKNNIAIYYPLQWEINLLELINHYPNKKFYFPAIKHQLEFREFKGFESFVDGPFHTKEPNTKSVPLDMIDIIFIPCVAISDTKQRLGYGKGYYDKALKDYQGIKVGICPSIFQNMKIEMEEYDIKLDLLIKE
ncbi:MAG: 5-formyltetrahydrofolate cyclo-ligase [Anaeroplasmataceae bacterium]|nr:5-formyltetrahydrofolate cyclo-ligase [Anaeroplasmataceae bacterium]